MELSKRHCVPCEGGVKPMPDKEEERLIRETPLWKLDRSGVHKIKREFTFKDFKEALAFVGKVAKIAEEENHHPNIYIFYNKVILELYTHAIKGLFENDFIMASKIDRIRV